MRTGALESVAEIIVDTAYHLHRSIGPGLLESIYETILAEKLRRQGLKVDQQVLIDVRYEDMVFPNALRLDLLVEDKIVVELKSIEMLAPVHAKQVITYLKVGAKPMGLLINFGGELFKGNARRFLND